MYHWEHIDGTKIKTKTIKAFSELTGLRHSNCKSLACGHYQTLHGWISPSKKAKRRKERVLRKLVNTITGEVKTLGISANAFARNHGLCENELWKLLRGHKVAYRHWVTERTYMMTQTHLAGVNI